MIRVISRDCFESVAIPKPAVAADHVQMKVMLVRGVALRVEDGREIEAAGGADGSLEGTGERRIFPTRFDRHGRALLEGEARDIDGVAARMFGNLAGRRIVAQPTDIG